MSVADGIAAVNAITIPPGELPRYACIGSSFSGAEPNMREIDSISVPILRAWPDLKDIVRCGFAYAEDVHVRKARIRAAINDAFPPDIIFPHQPSMRLRSFDRGAAECIVTANDLAAFLGDPQSHGVYAERGYTDLDMLQQDRLIREHLRLLHAIIWGLRRVEDRPGLGLPGVIMHAAKDQVARRTGFWWAAETRSAAGRFMHPLNLALATYWMCDVYREASKPLGNPRHLLSDVLIFMDDEHDHLLRFVTGAMRETAGAGQPPNFQDAARILTDRIRSW